MKMEHFQDDPFIVMNFNYYTFSYSPIWCMANSSAICILYKSHASPYAEYHFITDQIPFSNLYCTTFSQLLLIAYYFLSVALLCVASLCWNVICSFAPRSNQRIPRHCIIIFFRFMYQEDFSIQSFWCNTISAAIEKLAQQNIIHFMLALFV